MVVDPRAFTGAHPCTHLPHTADSVTHGSTIAFEGDVVPVIET
jgi:hypothetical protein